MIVENRKHTTKAKDANGGIVCPSCLSPASFDAKGYSKPPVQVVRFGELTFGCECGCGCVFLSTYCDGPEGLGWTDRVLV